MKKIFAAILIAVLILTAFTGCGGGSSNTGGSQSGGSGDGFNENREITVVSRESGSGTRGAFVELTGVEVRDANGNVTDMTTIEAAIGNSTNAIMTNVAGDTYAIGYISTGSMNDTVKAVNIDGIAPTAANILAGSYNIARPFIIVTGEGLESVAEDFINFIMSKEGQDILGVSYIPIDSGAPAFQSNGASGTIVIGGSTSVSPVMERLREAYLEINSGAVIEVHSTGSGAGITGAIDGVVDIGMSSRNIRDSELEQLDQSITICMDGIAIVVNNDNPTTNLTIEQVREMFTGEKTRWAEVQ